MEALSDGKRFKLLEPLLYRYRGFTIKVERGYITDLASTEPFQALVSKNGVYSPAAVIHAKLCDIVNKIENNKPIKLPPDFPKTLKTQSGVDWCFLDAMKNSPVYKCRNHGYRIPDMGELYHINREDEKPYKICSLCWSKLKEGVPLFTRVGMYLSVRAFQIVKRWFK